MSKTSIIETFDEDAPITQDDIDCGRLVRRERRGDGRLLPSKRRVTLYLDEAVVEHFEQLAGDLGCDSLINETLKTSIANAGIEATLRRVIREELAEARHGESG